MNKLPLIIAAALLAAPMAQANEQIARENQCFKCHAIDRKVKGPSFKNIAKNNSASEIETTVRKGVTSFFGSKKMPANKTMSDTDLKSLSQWILAQ